MSRIFDVVNTPLHGRHLIEASAGTGKTYSLIHIVLRLIVEEGLSIDRLLLVTFTKAATAELRQRVRELLITAREAFLSAKDDDEQYDKTLLLLVQKWREADISEEIFRQAIDRMDDASICTIHSFCQKMLEENKFSSSEGFDFEIGTDDDLRREVIDQFLRKELSATDNVALKSALIEYSPWKDLLKALTAAPEDRTVELFDQVLFIDPKTGKINEKITDAEKALDNEVKAVMKRFIDWAPQELKRKKRQSGIRSFDDLLLDMYSELDNPAFADRVRSRYDGILIDEFQDTDPIQYTIFKRLFLSDKSPARSVFFVGDPKQSIYRFRNADLNTYLAAREDIGDIFELNVNYRSNPLLLEAFNAFYTHADTPFLDSGVSYSTLEAGADKTPLMLNTSDGFKPLPVFEIWRKNPDTDLNPEANRKQQSELIASEISALLSGNVYKTAERKLQPGDIAILVRRKKDAEPLIQNLNKRGIRVLFQDENNIFITEEAREILWILLALEAPDDIRALRLARATRLMGESINAIVPEAFENESGNVIDDKNALLARELIEEAREIWTKRGVSAALARLMLQSKTQERLLPVQNGERRLANYQQLIEVLQEASLSLKGISGLARWLKQQITNPPDEEKYRLRIDSDADLVNIMTIHKSKGLEYPVVFLLYANELSAFKGNRYKKNVFKEVIDGKIHLRISFIPLYPEVIDSIDREDDWEILRLGYVGMTRASQRLVLPLNYFKSGKQLKGVDNGYTRSLTGSAAPHTDQYEKALDDLQNGHEKSALIVRTIEDDTTRIDWHDNLSDNRQVIINNDDLTAAPGRMIATSWFPTSYTAIARGATETTENLTLIEEKEDSIDEESDESGFINEVQKRKDSSELNILEFERGLESGTFLHSLFEKTDFTIVKNAERGIVEAETTLNRGLVRQLTAFKYHLEPYSVEEWLPVFNQLLKDVLCCTLVDKSTFATESDLRLCDLDSHRKTPEMSFTIAIGDAKEGRAPVTTKNLSRLLSHFDPIYHINIENDKELNGYLTGAIDLCFEFEGRYFVLDWKGTKLAEKPEDFTSERMLAEINRHHYSLQYLIYLVALRRHLMFCGINSPEEKIGGAIYAFIRGIRRSDASPYGVFVTRPPLALITCLDDFFENGYHEGVVVAHAAAAQTEKEEK